MGSRNSEVRLKIPSERVFPVKELEKLGAKKGVGKITRLLPRLDASLRCLPDGVIEVSQTVKDVLQALVDDHLIELDKIGTSNCKLFHFGDAPPK